MYYSKIVRQVACKMALLLAFIFAACSEDIATSTLAHEGGYTEETAFLENIKVVAQARRFEPVIIDSLFDSSATRLISSVFPGSIIRMSELDSITFQTTGAVYYSRSEDSTGVFSFDSISLNSPYVMLELSSPCCTYNEAEEKIAWADVCYVNDVHYIPYSLIVDLRESRNVGINVVTTMVTKRLLTLMSQGTSFEDAKATAESEILRALGIYGVPYRFDKIVSDENRTEILMADNLGVWLMTNYTQVSTLRITNSFGGSGSFNADSSIKDFLDKNVDSWIKSEWIDKDEKASLQDYMQNFMAAIYGLGQCTAENEGYSTTYPYSEPKNYPLSELKEIDFVCKTGTWSYLIHYAVSDSVGAVFGQMTDSRDSTKYKTVTYNIDGKTQTWLAENLKYNSADGLYFWHEAMNLPDSIALVPYESCIEEQKYSYCDRMQVEKKYLDYEKIWAITDSVKAASKTYQGICPDGWHLPDANEWQTLRDYVTEKLNLDLLRFEDIMAIAGFGESDAETGSVYTVKIDSTVHFDQNLHIPVYDPRISAVFIQNTSWAYVSIESVEVLTGFVDKNPLFVRCVKD